ncbi:hypothetical protein [Methylobacterium sp. J-077]|uniref:hypothetical protein n=1 Tax=Methylobacterium sp. J-077 TaxID=2836656 RepID=UPI001FBAEC51|nr:hypothetical protein [Methylobacterium sp. J-077]MCJ2126449.1 hypothetical protein [Methylobacterium sp. J-077]
MLTAAYYYNHIVRPTVDEFCCNNSDVRLAMLACMATLHVVDHVVQNRMPVTTKKEAELADAEVIRITNDLAERCIFFAAVRAYGTASKHGRIGLQRRFKPGFHTGSAYYAPPLPEEILVRTNVRFLHDNAGGIHLRWSEGGYINLTQSLSSLLPILETEFPELITA